FLNVLELTTKVIKKMGFDNFTAQISLRDPNTPEKYIGSDENWDAAQKAIIEATSEVDLITTTALGEAAFYGPKLDFMIKDALGRSWQLGTIQVDYNLPERFQLEYVGSDNKPHRPVMIHRAPFGSMERFISILIEHTAGKFPLWLTPDQYGMLPVSERLIDYCKTVETALKKYDIRGFIDDRNESLGRKIRDTELKRVPLMLIIGDKEAETGTVSVRRQGLGDIGSMTVAELAAYVQNEIDATESQIEK
ncbi:MAG TPA: threonine--tRNA ligase, partial [Saprospiraceae bacterium]|nr:threonine--tRNA ligase [Saprospiraceae bacterium]